jgi:hypothetical protein
MRDVVPDPGHKVVLYELQEGVGAEGLVVDVPAAGVGRNDDGRDTEA